MEKAVIVNREKGITGDISGYDVVYFGTEFCQWLLPTLTELMKVSDHCKEHGQQLVLLTPWVTDSGLFAVDRLVSDYLKREGQLEVTVNDIGMMKMLADNYGSDITLTAGRLLSNQRRDPRTLPLKDIGNDELYEHYQHSSFDYQPLVGFFNGYNVKRVEIDNLFQGVRVPADLTGVSFSLHYPYNYITVTRNCEFCYNDREWENKRACARRCSGVTLKLECDEIDEPMFQKGTATFVKNDDLPKEAPAAVDRLIFSPDVPL